MAVQEVASTIDGAATAVVTAGLRAVARATVDGAATAVVAVEGQLAMAATVDGTGTVVGGLNVVSWVTAEIDGDAEVPAHYDVIHNLEVHVDGDSEVEANLEAPTVPPPPGDARADAILLEGLAGILAGTTVGATTEPEEALPIGRVGIHNSVWHTWAAPASAMVTATVTADDPLRVVVLDAWLNGSLGTASGAGVATLTWFAGEGSTYLVRVSAATDGDVGDFTLTWALATFTSTPQNPLIVVPPGRAPQILPLEGAPRRAGRAFA